MLLAVMPRRQSDEVSGELLVEAYFEALGDWPHDAIDYLRREAPRRSKWFPTIHDCLEILGDWRRGDLHVTRRTQATLAMVKEKAERNRFASPKPEDRWKPKPGEIEQIMREAAEAVKA